MHKMTVSIMVIVLLAGLGGVAYFLLLKKAERWAVYYNDALPASDFKPYDLLAFDRGSHPPLAPLIAERKTLLGYISLGEAETFRDIFVEIEEKGLLLATGSEWKGNPVIDIRKPEWNAMVLDRLIPEILRQGFDGIMIDTADSVIWLENTYPDRYPGLKSALVGLIKAIRQRYPDLRIMLNRGFDIVPQLAGHIDMLLAESTMSTLNHQTKDFYLLPPEERKHYLAILQTAQKQTPRLKIYTVDYWPPDDVQGVKKIYAAQRRAGFVPYVSTMDLQSLTPEPE